MVILLATVGGCAYLFLFLFHHGNHHPAPAKDSASHPHTPVGASSSASNGLADCQRNPGCAKLGERGGLFCSRWSSELLGWSATVQLLCLGCPLVGLLYTPSPCARALCRYRGEALFRRDRHFRLQLIWLFFLCVALVSTRASLYLIAVCLSPSLLRSSVVALTALCKCHAKI